MRSVLALDCTMVVIVSLLGGMLPLATVLDHTRLQVYLSFSAGSMLGAAFFHMIPEAVRMGSAGTVRWAAAGLLALFFLERFFKFHHHESSDHDRSRSDELAWHHESSRFEGLSWGSAAFGLAVHSLVGGIALASAIAADFDEWQAVGATGWGVFLATVVHKPADALTIVTLMLRSGVPRRLAHLVNFAFAMMIPAGVVMFVLGVGRLSPDTAQGWTAISLAFSAGTFLCIALSDLLPELQFHSHDRLKLSLGLLAGFCLMIGTTLIEQL
jgi:zinc and cadmium transporter